MHDFRHVTQVSVRAQLGGVYEKIIQGSVMPGTHYYMALTRIVTRTDHFVK